MTSPGSMSFNPLYAGHKLRNNYMPLVYRPSFNPLYAGHKLFVIFYILLLIISVSIPYMRVTNSLGKYSSQSSQKGFNPLYAGHKQGYIKGVDYETVLFQSPICGSQTNLRTCIWSGMKLFQSPICGSQTSISIRYSLLLYKFQSPICGSQT